MTYKTLSVRVYHLAPPSPRMEPAVGGASPIVLTSGLWIGAQALQKSRVPLGRRKLLTGTAAVAAAATLGIGTAGCVPDDETLVKIEKAIQMARDIFRITERIIGAIRATNGGKADVIFKALIELFQGYSPDAGSGSGADAGAGTKVDGGTAKGVLKPGDSLITFGEDAESQLEPKAGAGDYLTRATIFDSQAESGIFKVVEE